MSKALELPRVPLTIAARITGARYLDLAAAVHTGKVSVERRGHALFVDLNEVATFARSQSVGAAPSARIIRALKSAEGAISNAIAAERSNLNPGARPPIRRRAKGADAA